MIEEQMGYLPEMKNMNKVYDRDDPFDMSILGTITGIRYIYEAASWYPCEDCGERTNRVIDYLGKLSFQCGCLE